MSFKSLIAAALVFFAACKSRDSKAQVEKAAGIEKPAILSPSDSNDNTYAQIAAIPIPGGFHRWDTIPTSFAVWLQQLGLKKDKTVWLFNGRKKINQAAQFAVLDVPVGDKDLQQCADAVMRLRASYLFDSKKLDSIAFYDNEKKAYRFSKPYSTEHFESYLQNVFAMCGTASLAKQLKRIRLEEIQPGDVLIRGGSPGHAVIVIDAVINDKGQKKFMLAQSYMPAQSIHVLLNVASKAGSPWYDLNEDELIETPEYTFRRDELMRW